MCYNRCKRGEEDMIDAFITLFTEADLLFYSLFALAILLLIAEVFIPSFGIVGMGGVLSAIGAIVARTVEKNISSTQTIFYIIYIVLSILIVVGLIKLLNKAGSKLKERKRYAIVDGNKIPLTKDGYLDYSFLVGKEGEVVADLKPAGKVKIDGKVYEVTTTKEYIYSGTIIRVDKVINQKVVVRKKG
ncbi:MAG: hypothetical protein IJB98_02965 [Clostridia bacterium]|nr:hypothetical protein [Clostridia bacterium]